MQAANIKKNSLLQPFFKTHEKIVAWFEGLANALESPHISFATILGTFLSCLLVRNFLEAFSQRSFVFLDFDSRELMIDLAHFEASFTTIALLLTILLHFLIKVPVVKVIRVVLTSFLLVLLAPVMDLLASGGEGIDLRYLDQQENLNFLLAYLTFFGDYVGATIGIRIEVALALVAVYFYSYAKTKDFFTSLVAAFLSYTLIFLWGATPFFVKPLVELFGFQYQYAGLVLLRYFMVINFILAVWLAFLANKERFLAFVREIPILRVMYYEAMFLFGVSLSFRASSQTIKGQFQTNPALAGNGILLMIAICLAMLSAMVINNLSDTEIDKISNSKRMLVSGRINSLAYKKLAWIFAACALIYASFAGMHAIFFISLVMATYYLYSSYPLRLKRITVFSKLVISGNSLILMLLGFWFVSENISNFPKLLYPIMLCGFTLGANFIDLKDVSGDQALGIKTLPVVLGMKYAQWFCAVTFFIAFVSLYYVFDEKIPLLLFVVTGLLQAWVLARKKYDELPVFLVLLGGIFSLMIYLLCLNQAIF